MRSKLCASSTASPDILPLSPEPFPFAKLRQRQLKMAYFFSTPVDIDVVLKDTEERSMVDVKLDKNRREKTPLYKDGESVKGDVTVRPKDGKRLEHTGIKVQFIGTIGQSIWRMRIFLFQGRPGNWH